MSDETSTRFKLDLDSEAFMSGLKEATTAIKELGESKNLAGLVSGLSEIVALAAPVALAIGAIVAIIGSVEKAEGIKAINSQFEALAKNAGLSRIQVDELRESLVKAGGGLATETEIIHAANRGLVEMAGNAKALPELLETARKVTLLFGGSLTENFERLNHAIATGHTRLLAQMGIVLDVQGAHERYARSIGLTVDELTEFDKKQANLNETLKQSHEQLDAATKGIQQTKTAWQQTKTAIEEVYEAIVLLVDKAFGPLIRILAKDFAEAAENFKTWVTSKIGDGAAKAAAQAEVLRDRIWSVKEQIDQINKNPGLYADAPDRIKELTGKLADLRAELVKNQATSRSEKKTAATEEAPANQTQIANSRRNDLEHAEKKAKAQERIIALSKQQADAELSLARTTEQVDAAIESQKNAAFALEKNRIDQANILYARNMISRGEQEKRITSAHAQASAEIARIDQKRRADEIAALNAQLYDTQRVDKQIALSAQITAKQSAEAWQKSGALGAASMKAFLSHSKSAFIELGEGTKDATEIMKGFFFGMLGDIAEQQGEVMMLSSIWPPNPLGFAGGAALLALSGFLHSQAGGGSSGSAGSGISAGGAGSFASSPALADVGSPATASAAAAASTPRNSVTIQVMGNYFETEETKRRLAEIIREHQDATDFTFKEIGHA